MIGGRDSSFQRPNAAIVQAARQAGVGVWGGYLQTRPGVRLASPWQLADFEQARQLGGMPLAFCSGLDDPALLARLAQNWRVRLLLDVEDGIRQDGPWVQGFLDVSGAGLYGLGSVHWEHGGGQRRAACHIVARYPGDGDPGATWDGSPRPDGHCGWQWQGTHTEFGISVDSMNLDDWFQTGEDDPMAMEILTHIRDGVDAIWDFDEFGAHAGQPVPIIARLPIIEEKLDQLLKTQAQPVDVKALAQEIVAEITPHLSPGADPDAVAAAVLAQLKSRL